MSITLKNPTDALNFIAGPSSRFHMLDDGQQTFHPMDQRCALCDAEDEYNKAHPTTPMHCTQACTVHGVVTFSTEPATGDEHQCTEACDVDNCPCLERTDVWCCPLCDQSLCECPA
jgi:hypothetical protein